MTAAALFCLALVLRVIVLLTTVDLGGDAAFRAMEAYAWAKAPHVITHGIWLPGFHYLMGSANLLMPVPRLASRTVNLALGALTVPVLYVLVRRLYGPAVAVISAVTLAVMPLHLMNLAQLVNGFLPRQTALT